jgi:hypothetical protein
MKFVLKFCVSTLHLNAGGGGGGGGAIAPSLPLPPGLKLMKSCDYVHQST